MSRISEAHEASEGYDNSIRNLNKDYSHYNLEIFSC